MNSATQTTPLETDATADDLVCMGLEFEEDIARDEGLNGRAETFRHIRRAVEEAGGLVNVLALIREVALGASDMDVDAGTSASESAAQAARFLAMAAMMLGGAK